MLSKEKNSGTRIPVQVYVGSEMVGTLDVASYIYESCPEFVVMLDGDEEDEDGMGSRSRLVQLKFGRQECRLPSDILAGVSGRHSVILNQRVPPYAERYKDAQSMDVVFTWRAINTDIDTYEQIFDLESFRPV